MQWFANLKTSYKLALSFGTCLVLTAIIGTTALYRMAQLNSATALLVSDSVDGLKYAGNVTENMMTFRRLELQYLLLSDKASKSSSIKQMNDELAELDMHMAEYEQSADHAQDRRNLAELKRLWATYLQGHPKFMELCRRNDLKRAKAYVANESSGSFASVDRQLDVIRTWNEAQAAVQTKSAAAVYSTGRSVILGLLVAAVALGLFSAFVVTRRITTAMSQIDSRISSIHNVCIANLSVAIEAMARGDLTSRIDTGTELLTIQSRDEFGNMAHTVNRVIQKLHAMVASFLNAQDALSKTLGQVQTSADSIAAATAEVAAGNEDLSQRTEEQASSLEETASSMEQMTATVKQSAENARHANQLAMQARTVAEKGGDVVGSAIASMDEINHVSKQIADIVSVIDEIAFQTNLLALNAAVEAARVGEQGRGFAVVAAEVRTLAGRSATASKEIKALVHESVTRVQQGTVLVNQSGAQLSEIVTAVKKVADMIAEISAAGQEQSAGIEQVNKAVMQMDQITQQNAALAEQATAASQSMNVQAGSLLEAVSQFTIDSQYLSAPVAPALREVEVVAATGTYGGGRRRFRSAGAPTLKLSRVSSHGDPVVKDDDFGEF